MRASAVRRYGAPEYLVTDGGGIFYSTIALQIYDSLGIQKERIEPGAPWQNYAETLFSIQRRLADYGFSKATTWPEMVSEHQKWMRNYNIEHHFAHRERQDGRHSPDDVLRGVLGRTYPEPVLDRILYATRFTRYLDRDAYVRFRNWRLFGENGLAGEEVSISSVSDPGWNGLCHGRAEARRCNVPAGPPLSSGDHVRCWVGTGLEQVPRRSAWT